MQEFTADLKHRMKGVKETLSWWTATRTTTNWPNEHSRFATPFSRNERMLTIVPRYLHLNLSKHVMHNVSRLPLRVLWKLRQQRGLMMVLAYVTNVLLMMNIIRTRCMLFYFAKTNELWAEETFFFSVNAFFWGFFSSPSLFAATSQQPTFIITFLSRTLDSFQRWSSEAPNKGTLGKWLEYLRRNWLISSLGAMS